MKKLKIAVQKSGRLSEKSLELFRECGIQIPNGTRKLKAAALNFPVEFLFLRDDDIPQYVEQSVADIGIIGENEVWEQEKDIRIIRKLGFAGCRLSLAIPKEKDYSGLSFFQHKRIATSYPNILRRFFAEKEIPVMVEKLSGSVEIATGIGLADGIFDVVSTGSTLLMNGLKEVEVVANSEAVLIASPQLSDDAQLVVDQICFRIKAVQDGCRNRYIMMNVPNEAIPSISALLPGMKSPSVLPLAEPGWSSLHSVVRETEFWDVIEQLKAQGAQGILILPIEKMII